MLQNVGIRLDLPRQSIIKMEDQKRTWVQTSNSIWFFRLIQQNKQEPIIVQLLADQKTIKACWILSETS